MKSDIILIKNGIVVTMNPSIGIIKNGAVAIEGDKILDVGNSERLKKEYKTDIVVEASGMAVLPGLINTHVHLYQNLLKGLNDDSALVEWLKRTLYPLRHVESKKVMSGDFRVGYYGALMACLEMIRSGTTCFVSMDEPNPWICRAIEETGIRGFYGITLRDRWTPKDAMLPIEKQLEIATETIRKWHGSEGGRIKCMIAPTTPFACSEELLLESEKMSDKFGLRLSIHISETPYEVKLVKKEKGRRPVEFLDKINFLSPKVLAAHCIWVSEKEIKILKEREVKVSHNPESNMKLGSGVAPIPRMLKEGITVSLATDGAASNDNLDMFEAIRTSALLHKLASQDPSVISAEKVMQMATIDAARAIGEENRIGSIEAGKKADLILINLKKPHLQPIHDVVKTLVYCANGSDVEMTIVDGKIILKNGRILGVNEGRIIREAEEVVRAALMEAEEYLPKASWLRS